MAAATLLPACTEEDYKLYDTNQKDSVFFEYRNDKNELVDQIDYVFNFDIAQSHTIEVPIILMGMPKDYDRTVSIIPVAEGTDMVEGINYTITNNIIPANAVKGKAHVNLLRGLDPDILSGQKTLKITITENEDLKSVGENYFSISYSDIRPDIRPGWWLENEWIPVYSYETAQYFFDYFYRLAPEANINIFNEIIDTYGDYFVKGASVRGPFTMYAGFLRQYVLIPLYNDHPELDWKSSPLW